mmetsp:Transcript_32685/g.72203  ORF Transcript_32685/g.72203 Transcript_32685/m.72203 type:complete len:211 (+) Transcript_32685:1427-2059(+)
MQQHKLITRALETPGPLEVAVEGPQHLPPVADGSWVDEVDEIKHDGVSPDDVPLDRVNKLPCVLHMEGHNLLVAAEPPVLDVVGPINDGIPAPIIIVQVGVHAMRVVAAHFRARGVLVEVPPGWSWCWAASRSASCRPFIYPFLAFKVPPLILRNTTSCHCHCTPLATMWEKTKGWMVCLIASDNLLLVLELILELVNFLFQASAWCRSR